VTPGPEPPRRFPPPLKIPGGHVVRDATGQALAYLYSRENEAEARQAKVLTADEGRQIATSIARLPEQLGKGEASRNAWARLRGRFFEPDATPRAKGSRGCGFSDGKRLGDVRVDRSPPFIRRPEP
jgi:hypothetical protein